ncbi:hypothetical protein [Streptomyces sp. NPDC002619]|uniref:hypothetical protein n=1 Tax=Streptomyces sp. NPDC002619 TaxID=3364655 RepID=UPI0036A19DBC
MSHRLASAPSVVVAAAAVAAVVLVLALPYEALSHEAHSHARVTDDEPAPRLFGAECRTTVNGSHVVVYCHNPYVDTDRVSLHVECDRWWDLDTDDDPVDVGPAATVRLAGRCWKDVRSTWVSHQKAG